MDKNPGPKPRINLFGYLDETGLLHSPATDKVFGLGLTICHNPKQLHRDIINFRNKRKFYKEFKFTEIRNENLPVYKGLVDIFFNTTNNMVNFFSFFILFRANHKISAFFKKHFFA